MSDTEKPMEEYKKALKCLYIAVDESVAKDIEQKVVSKINQTEDWLAKTEQELADAMRHMRVLKNERAELKHKLRVYRETCDKAYHRLYGAGCEGEDPREARARTEAMRLLDEVMGTGYFSSSDESEKES